jgi:hypothetical protein
VDFRRTFRIGFDLPVLTDWLLDLSQFQTIRALAAGGQGDSPSQLDRRCSDGINFVVELVGELDAGKENGGECECEIEKVVERQLNLRHPCIAAPIGFAVSGGDGADAIELRALRLFVEGGSLADVVAVPPPRWTATAKAIAVAGLVLDLRVANGVGQRHGCLRPICVLFEVAGAIQIAGIGRFGAVAVRSFRRRRLRAAAPRLRRRRFFRLRGL